MISSFTHLQNIKNIFSVVYLKSCGNCVALHNQNPPHYNSASVSRKYVLQKTACDHSHTHKCPENTVGAAWGESPWHRSIEFHAVGFPSPAHAIFGPGEIRLPGSKEFSKMLFLISSGFNPSYKEEGEKLTSGFVKMSPVNVLNLFLHTLSKVFSKTGRKNRMNEKTSSSPKGRLVEWTINSGPY